MEIPPVWLIASVGVLLIATIWFVPKLQARKAASSLTSTERPMAENEFRKTLGQLIGGCVI